MKYFKSIIDKDRLFIGLLLLSIGVFCWDLLLLKTTFLHGDYKLQFFPWSDFYSQCVKAYQMPLWNANMGIGFPVFAEGQVGALYPLNIAMFLLLPFFAAYTYSIVLHFILGGIFMYIFLKRIGLAEIAAALPAILFMFSSPYAGCFSNIASLKVLCWFPLVLYVVFVSIDEGRPLFILWAGIIMGLQLLAGAVQMAAYSIVASVLYFIFFVLVYRTRETKLFLKYLLCFAFALLAAFAVYSPQFMATNELVRASGRSQATLEFALLNSFFPAGIITLVFPYLATIFRAMIYIGILPLFFAMAALHKVKDKNALFFTLMFGMALFFSFGQYNPLYVLLLKATKLYFFRTPSKLLFFSAFSLIALSGFGIDYLLHKIEKKDLSRMIRGFVLDFIGAVAVIFGANIALNTYKVQILDFAKRYVEKHIIGSPLHRQSAEVYLFKAEQFYENAVRAVSMANAYIYVPLLLIFVSLLLLFLFYKGWIKRGSFKALVCIFVLCDLLYFSSIGSGFRGNIMPLGQAAAPNKITEFLKKDRSLYRIYIFGSESFQDSLGLKANQNMYFEVDNIGAYTPLVPTRYHELLYELGCADDSLGVIKPGREALAANMHILRAFNTKYIISEEALIGKDLKIVESAGTAKIYENRKVLPRAYIVSDFRAFEFSREALAFMKSPAFDPSKLVVLEEKPDLIALSAQERKISVIYVKKYTDREVVIKTSTDTDGFLVLSDYFYPGWKAFIDNKETRIYRANYVVRAIYLPPGQHEVKFVYRF